jgi:hypothetical protein
MVTHRLIEVHAVEDGVRLIGADVFWLAARALARRNDEQAILAQTVNLTSDFIVDLSALHLEQAILNGAHLEHIWRRPIYSKMTAL